MLLHALIAVLGGGLASIASPWADLSIVSPATQANTADEQITWIGGGSRRVLNSWASGGTLEYRLDAGAWTTYTQGGTGFTMTSGQTLAWRMTLNANQSTVNANVTINGAALDTFSITASGFP